MPGSRARSCGEHHRQRERENRDLLASCGGTLCMHFVLFHVGPSTVTTRTQNAKRHKKTESCRWEMHGNASPPLLTATPHVLQAIMTDRVSQESVSEREMDLWCRVIGRRRAEWSSLPPAALVAIVHPMWTNEQSPPVMEDPWERTEFLLKRYFNFAVDRQICPKKRRASWHRLNTLLQNLDEALSRAPRQGSSLTNAAPHSSNDGTASQQSNALPSCPQKAPEASAKSSVPAPVKETTHSAPIPSRSLPSAGNKPLESQPAASLASQKSSTASKKPAATAGEAPPPQQQQQQQQPPQKLPPPQKQKGAPQTQAPGDTGQQQGASARDSQPVAISGAQPVTAGAVPARATPTPPSTSLVQRPVAGNKQHIGSMGSAFSSTAKVAPVTTTNANKAAPPPKKTAPPRPLVPVSISFGPDTNRFAAAVDKNGRSSLRVTFQQRAISNEESQRTVERFQQWDPYWKIQHIVGMVETFPISRLENLKTGTKPEQATECTIKLDAKYAAMVRDWGKSPEKGKRYKHGETRLLVRMLPMRLAQKKRPRADTHLWPKGTFVQLIGMPVSIDQRRQQQHDPSQWKSMSTPLDLTPKISHPKGVNKLQLYFLDNEPYVMCVALCSYVSPDTLNSVVWNENWVKKLSIEEAKAKALENANRQTVVLEDTDTSNDISSFIFPLSCPVSQQLLKTPVRGKTCNHWQCFDLNNFVESNSHITGTRWECPVCRNILSLRDLEYCPLTASILKEYETEAAPHRDRVQFFANGTWKLLDEAKKRYSKKRPVDGDTVNGNKRARSEGSIPSLNGHPEIIELDL